MQLAQGDAGHDETEHRLRPEIERLRAAAQSVLDARQRVGLSRYQSALDTALEGLEEALHGDTARRGAGEDSKL